MKVVAFNGSPRKGGNTSLMIDYVFQELEKEGIETEKIEMGGKQVRGCIACRKCFENQNNKCIIDNDPVNEWIEKMVEADGIILASPTYFANITAEIKALIDRAGYVTLANGGLLRRKVGASVVVSRRGGAIHTFNSLNHFFTISQMVIPGSRYWNMGFGLDKGEVEEDEEGKLTMSVLGENMAWLLKKIGQ